jgi:DNA transformation protein
MNPAKGAWLYVNLSASQARRRLQGFGHGVRKIETAGRNRAAILHTATGDHLRELEHLLADVLVTEEEDRPDDAEEDY